jgi:hypothetical protein
MSDRCDNNESDARIAESSMALDELCARISYIFVRKNLSPPHRLRSAAKGWLGLSHNEIVEVIGQHFATHRRGYHSGSGDQLFHVLQADIRRALAVETSGPRPGRQ